MDEHHECISLAGCIQFSLEVAVDQLRSVGDQTLKIPVTEVRVSVVTDTVCQTMTQCRDEGGRMIELTICSYGTTYKFQYSPSH